MNERKYSEAKLIYENAFDKTPADWQDEMRTDWVMEGKGVPECGKGYLSLRSEIFTVPRDRDGHFNFWLKRDFPANVAFEWEFRYEEPGENGLAILAWAARGRGGEDIFDPSLPERKGEDFQTLHSGGINCYHTSYIARGRKVANLRKNFGFHLVASGPDLSTISKPNEWHKVRVEQFRDNITLFLDETVSFAYLDDGSAGGTPIRDGGKMCFRQQNNLYNGHYRNLKVFSLK